MARHSATTGNASLLVLLFDITEKMSRIFLDISGAQNLQLLTAVLEFSANFRFSFPRNFLQRSCFFIKLFEIQDFQKSITEIAVI